MANLRETISKEGTKYITTTWFWTDGINAMRFSSYSVASKKAKCFDNIHCTYFYFRRNALHFPG